MAYKCGARNVKLFKQKNKILSVKVRVRNNTENLNLIFDKYEFNATILVNLV